MASFEARGVELGFSEAGEGSPSLLLHETGVDSRAWLPVASALAPSARAIVYDRRGWGASTAPEGYSRTTVPEQSEDSVELLAELAAGEPAVLAGAGLGAVMALDLMLRRPDLVAGAVLVEPPLLALLPEATEMLGADGRAIEAVAGDGRGALVELYLSGGLAALGAGAERLPPELAVAARERPASLIAELGAVPAWEMPVSRLAAVTRPALIVTCAGTPPLLLAAAEALSLRLAAAELRQLASPGVPHVVAPERIAELVAEVAEA